MVVNNILVREGEPRRCLCWLAIVRDIFGVLHGTAEHSNIDEVAEEARLTSFKRFDFAEVPRHSAQPLHIDLSLRFIQRPPGTNGFVGAFGRFGTACVQWSCLKNWSSETMNLTSVVCRLILLVAGTVDLQ